MGDPWSPTRLNWKQAAAIAQCVAANAQVHYGLGQHMDKLAPGAIDNVYIVSTRLRSMSGGLKRNCLGKALKTSSGYSASSDRNIFLRLGFSPLKIF